MVEMLRGRLLVIAVAATAVVVGVVLLVPVHPESGILHLLSGMLPAGALTGGSPGWWALEDLGNVGLFVPVGAVAARLLGPLRGLLVGVGVSAVCETAQLAIPARHASVQDVLMNAIGVGIGVVVAIALGRIAARRQVSATSPHSVQAQ